MGSAAPKRPGDNIKLWRPNLNKYKGFRQLEFTALLLKIGEEWQIATHTLSESSVAKQKENCWSDDKEPRNVDQNQCKNWIVIFQLFAIVVGDVGKFSEYHGAMPSRRKAEEWDNKRRLPRSDADGSYQRHLIQRCAGGLSDTATKVAFSLHGSRCSCSRQGSSPGPFALRKGYWDMLATARVVVPKCSVLLDVHPVTSLSACTATTRWTNWTVYFSLSNRIATSTSSSSMCPFCSTSTSKNGAIVLLIVGVLRLRLWRVTQHFIIRRTVTKKSFVQMFLFV